MGVGREGGLEGEGGGVMKEILEKGGEYGVVEEEGKNMLMVKEKWGEVKLRGGEGLGEWVRKGVGWGGMIEGMVGEGKYEMRRRDGVRGV